MPIHPLNRLLVALQMACLLGLAVTARELRPWPAAPLLLAGLGLGLAGVWSQRHQLRVHPEPDPDGELVTHGIYRHLRHPMYAALAWGGLGAWLLDPTPWRLALYAALCVVLTLKIRREEQALRRHYPGYAHYAARTGRILPRLW